MAQYALTVGGPGCGKTYANMEVLDKLLELGFNPVSQIGYFTITRAGRLEAATRAASAHGVSLDELVGKAGSFATIHAQCRRLAGIDPEGILDDGADSLREIEKWLGAPITLANGDGNDGWVSFDPDSEAGAALTAWNFARLRIVSLSEAIAYFFPGGNHRILDGLTVKYLDYVRRYEDGKAREGRTDFVDMLATYSGASYPLGDHDTAAVSTTPVGKIPLIHAAFVDEAQDLTPLAMRAIRRITSAARYIYVTGDPFQGIFQWAGAVPRMFMESFQYAKSKILNKTYRLPDRILAYSEKIIASMDGYFDRGIQPRHAGGTIDVHGVNGCEYHGLIPGQGSVMFLGRTNYQVKEIEDQLVVHGVPFKRIRGRGVHSLYPGTDFRIALKALNDLRAGTRISGSEWRRVIEQCPIKHQETALLDRGGKTFWGREEIQRAYPSLGIADLMRDGIRYTTQDFFDHFARGEFDVLLGIAGDYKHHAAAAASLRGVYALYAKEGLPAILQPRVSTSTIHGAKGMEADRVICRTDIPGRVIHGIRDSAHRLEEETQVFYVAATRAREHLSLLESPNVRNNFPLPAEV